MARAQPGSGRSGGQIQPDAYVSSHAILRPPRWSLTSNPTTEPKTLEWSSSSNFTTSNGASYNNPPGTYRIRYVALSGAELEAALSGRPGKTACWRFRVYQTAAKSIANPRQFIADEGLPTLTRSVWVLACPDLSAPSAWTRTDQRSPDTDPA